MGINSQNPRRVSGALCQGCPLGSQTKNPLRGRYQGEANHAANPSQVGLLAISCYPRTEKAGVTHPFMLAGLEKPW